MTTNLHYLIAGMAVLLVVLWQYSHQRQMDDRNSLMFRRLLTVVSLDVLAELVSTCFILYAPYSFGVGRMLSNTVFYLFQAILPLMLLYYVCTLCSSRVISTGTVLRMGIPTIALVFIILTNPFTEKLFYFDSTGYCYGPWYLLLYISALLHIAAAAIFVAVHRDAVSRRNLTALLTVFLLAAFGIAAQAVNPAVLTTGFGLSLSILAMYLTINNPCACMDSLTGLNDKQYLLRRMNELTDAHKAFHIITVYAYQLDHMNKVSGVQSGSAVILQIIAQPVHSVHVEVVGRLIEQQHIGLLKNDAGEVNARFFAAGEQVKLLRTHFLRDFKTVAYAVDLVIAVVAAEDFQPRFQLRVALEQRCVIRLARHFVGQRVHCCRNFIGLLERQTENVLHGRFRRKIRHLVNDTGGSSLSERNVSAVIRQPAGQNIKQSGLSGAVCA